MANNAQNSDVKKLAELIKDIEICMFTTVGTDGVLHSRPMATQQAEFDGTLWFFTGASSLKVNEIHQEHHVNISYAKPDDQRYVSVSGVAQIVRDREKAKELWNPMYKAWFPKGLDDPELTLLQVRVSQAEYWDAQSSAVVHLIGFAKAIATGQQYEPGEHEKVVL